MSSHDAIDAIAEIVQLLHECQGSQSKIEWLESRVIMLNRPGLTAAIEAEVLREIHQQIPGMNGLTDQYLVPPQSSRYDEASANAKLEELAERLFELTS